MCLDGASARGGSFAFALNDALAAERLFTVAFSRRVAPKVCSAHPRIKRKSTISQERKGFRPFDLIDFTSTGKSALPPQGSASAG